MNLRAIQFPIYIGTGSAATGVLYKSFRFTPMKRHIYLLLILITVLITSCATDDEATPTPEVPLIIGEWVLVGQSYNGQDDELTDCQLQETYTFNQDGTSVSYYEDTPPGAECQFYTETQTYDIDGEVLTLYFGADTEFTYEILTLNATQLRFINTARNGTTLDADNRTTYTYTRVE